VGSVTCCGGRLIGTTLGPLMTAKRISPSQRKCMTVFSVVWTVDRIAALNRQNPGTQIQAVALFNSGISDVVLENAFGLGEKAVQKIQYTVEAANKKP